LQLKARSEKYKKTLVTKSILLCHVEVNVEIEDKCTHLHDFKMTKQNSHCNDYEKNLLKIKH